MRILRIDSWDGRSGGGQEYVRSVADELARLGHPQRLLSLTSDASYAPRPDERVFRVRGGGIKRTASDVTSDVGFLRWAGEEIAAFGPDIVHLHHFEAEFASIARLVHDLEVPLVFTAHDASLVCPISTLIRPGAVVCEGGVLPRCGFTGCQVGLGLPYNLAQSRSFDRLVRPRVRVFLCPSSLLVRYLGDLGFRPAVHLPPFAVIPPEVRGEAYPWPEGDAGLRIGYIGRLEEYKGVLDLVRALPTLRARWPSLRVTIAGEGPAREAMAALASELGVAEVLEWAGHAAGAAKEAWFRSVSLVVVPSSAWENFGLVALEALTRGRPVVATNFGGLPDIVQDRESGRLVPVGDPARLAEAIGEILADPRRARAWGLEGRRRALARFTPELHLERLLAVYAEVLAGRPLTNGTAAAELVRASPA